MNESSGFSTLRLHHRQVLTRFGLTGLGLGLDVLAACAPSAWQQELMKTIFCLQPAGAA